MSKYHGPLFLVFFILLTIICGIVLIAAFLQAPVLCASFVVIIYIIGLYLSTESNQRFKWHDAQEFENRFWTLTAFLFSTVVFYAKDSPFAIGRWDSSLGVFLVISFTLAVQYYDRKLHRMEISRKPKFHTPNMNTFSHKLLQYKATASEKTKLIVQCLSQIDRMYLPSTINNMLNLTKVKRQEQRVYRIMAGASKEELNYIINHITLALLFYKVKDHTGGLHRTLLLELLCKTRVSDLTIPSKASVLHAMMVMKLTAHKYSEEWTRNIILRTSGDDLSKLKAYMDSKGDVHSMHKLIFIDIRDKRIQEDILTHIRQQAAVQAAHMSLGTKYARLRKQNAWRKVLSDVDDTLFSSGGRYPAGIDSTHPRHELYPGVLSFYCELDKGTCGPEIWEDGRLGNLVFLSARPHVYKDVSEKKSYARFQELYDTYGMHALPTLLAGSLTSGRAYMMQGDLEPMAMKKYENFCQYYQLYPEYTHVFIGDNGQGDVRAAELILKKYGNKVLEAAYIHLVQPIEKTFGYDLNNPIYKKNWNNKTNIYFFKTYVGAAVQAFQCKQIRISGMKQICLDAIKQFHLIQNWSIRQDEEKCRLELNEDLIQANYLFNIHQLPSVELIGKPGLYSKNRLVNTPFGEGIIRDYRCVDGMYHVDLIEWRLKYRQWIKIYCQENILSPCFDNNEMKSSLSLNRHILSYIICKHIPNALNKKNHSCYPIHSKIQTHYGIGKIKKYRPRNGIYLVDMSEQLGKNVVLYTFHKELEEIKKEKGASSPLFSVRSSFGYFTKKFSFLQPSCGKFTIGSFISTPFGKGIIQEYHEEKCIYVILFEENNLLKAYVHEKDCVEVFSKNIPKTPIRKSIFSLFGRTSSEVNNYPNNEILSLQEDEKKKMIMKNITSGMYVSTPFGQGKVIQYENNICWIHYPSFNNKKEIHQNINGYIQLKDIQSIYSLNENQNTSILSSSISSSASSSSSSSFSYGSGILAFLRKGFTNENDKVQQQNVINYHPKEEKEITSCWMKENMYVNTIYGYGRIESIRFDGIIIISLDQLQLNAYFQSNQIQKISSLTKYGMNNIFEGTFEFIKESLITSKEPSSTIISLKNSFSNRFIIPSPKFPISCYVQTNYGRGQILSYHDYIYHILLMDINNNDTIHAYLQEDNCHWIQRGKINQVVNTKYGLGILQEVRQNDGIHIVKIINVMGSMQTYLNVNSIYESYFELKAMVGQMVKTPFGVGFVLRYYQSSNAFVIAMQSLNSHKNKKKNLKFDFVLAYVKNQHVIPCSNSILSHPSTCRVM